MRITLQTAEAELLAKLLDYCLDEVEARNRNADRQALRDLLRDNEGMIPLLQRRLREEFGDSDGDFASEHGQAGFSRPTGDDHPGSTEKDHSPRGPEWLR